MPIAYPYKFSDWYGYDKDCAPSVPFPITATNYSKPAFACYQSTTATAYFPNGAPTTGDVVYSNSAGTVFQGVGFWGVNVLSTNSNFKMTIGSNGVITAYAHC